MKQSYPMPHGGRSENPVNPPKIMCFTLSKSQIRYIIQSSYSFREISLKMKGLSSTKCILRVAQIVYRNKNLCTSTTTRNATRKKLATLSNIMPNKELHKETTEQQCKKK